MAATIDLATRLALRSAMGGPVHQGDRVVDALDAWDDPGIVVYNSLKIATNPTATDTVTIGSDVYEFVAAAGDVAADTNIAVERGADAGESRGNLIAAINTIVDADNEHPTIFQTDSTTPALCNGTENVVAVENGTSVEIRLADSRGGDAIKGSASLAVAETMTAAADIWLFGSVNFNTLGGRAKGPRKVARYRVPITAAMVTAGLLPIDLSELAAAFGTAIAGVEAFAVNSSNAAVDLSTDVFTISGGALTIALTGGGAPALADGDTLFLTIWGE